MDSEDGGEANVNVVDPPLIHLLPQLEEFFKIKDPKRVEHAVELLAKYSSEDEMFAGLQAEYGDVGTETDHDASSKKIKTEEEKFIVSSDEGDESEDLEAAVPIVVCKYGTACYRKNPIHFEEFAHPWRNQ